MIWNSGHAEREINLWCPTLLKSIPFFLPKSLIYASISSNNLSINFPKTHTHTHKSTAYIASHLLSVIQQHLWSCQKTQTKCSWNYFIGTLLDAEAAHSILSLLFYVLQFFLFSRSLEGLFCVFIYSIGLHVDLLEMRSTGDRLKNTLFLLLCIARK